MMTPTAVKVDHTIMPAHARKDTLFFLHAQLNYERNIIGLSMMHYSCIDCIVNDTVFNMPMFNQLAYMCDYIL